MTATAPDSQFSGVLNCLHRQEKSEDLSLFTTIDLVDDADQDNNTMTGKSVTLLSKAAGDNEVTTSKPATPLPISAIVAVTTVFICEGFAYTFLFPFIGFMIVDFGLAKDESETGYYAGILTGAFALAELFSGFIYGVLADRMSKKMLVLVSIMGCAITIGLFGVSTNFTLALVFRALNGAMSGAVCITKAYISDITDSSNQARAFALVTVGWGVGAVGGPAVGGFLSSPATKYPTIFGNMRLFVKFPYLLPCLFATGLMLVGFLVVSLSMKKYPKLSGNNVDGSTILDQQTQQLELMEMQYSSTAAPDASEDQPQCGSNDCAEIEEEPLNKLKYNLSSEKAESKARVWHSFRSEVKQTGSLLCNREVGITIVLYFLYLVVEIFQDELLPLWSMIDAEKGGLSFNTIQIGIVQAILGFLYLVLPVTYELLAKRLGHLNSMRLGFILTISLMFTPQLAIFRLSKPLLWTGFTLYSLLRAFCGMITFTAVVILINNAAPEGTSGKVMAFSNSSGCLARFVAPFVAGPCLAFSANLSNKFRAPIFLNIPFVLFGAICASAVLLSISLKKSLNVPKGESESTK